MSAGIVPHAYSGAYRKKAEEIRLRVTLEYAPAYAKAPWWKKQMIQLKIERQVRNEMKAFDPSHWV